MAFPAAVRAAVEVAEHRRATEPAVGSASALVAERLVASGRVDELAGEDDVLREHLSLLWSELVAFQCRSLAERWLDVVREVAAADRAAGERLGGDGAAGRVVAASATGGRGRRVHLAAVGRDALGGAGALG